MLRAKISQVKDTYHTPHRKAFTTSLLAGEVLGDVDLVWANCRSFNEPDSEICDFADQAQQALRMRWQQEGLPTVTPIPPSPKKKKKDGRKRALDPGDWASSSAGVVSDACLSLGMPGRLFSLFRTRQKRMSLVVACEAQAVSSCQHTPLGHCNIVSCRSLQNRSWSKQREVDNTDLDE